MDLTRGTARLDARLAVIVAAVAAVMLAVAGAFWTPAGLPLPVLITVTVIVAAGFFLAAGTYRLARWRIARDPHSGLVGSALMIVGGLALPARPLVDLVVTDADGLLVGPACRGVASFIAVALVLRALRTHDLGPHETPSWVLPTAFAVCAGTFISALAVELHLIPTSPRLAHAVIVTVIALGWAGLSVVTHRQAHRLAWAGRVSPLLAGMAVAEGLRAVGLGAANAWTLSGVMLTAAVAILATRAAVADLDRATEANRLMQQRLYQQLGIVTGDVEDYAHWRSEVMHDAHNTCAGLRAAMNLLYEPGRDLRPDTAQRLRDAAVIELQQLEDLLTTHTTDAEELDLAEALHAAASPLQLMGAAITVSCPPTRVLGDHAGLVLVVLELLTRSFTDTPDNRVSLTVHRSARTTRIQYTELHPVATRSEGEAELRAVRHLLRRHGGDLRLHPAAPRGNLLELTLPTAVPPPRPLPLPTLAVEPEARLVEENA